MKEKARHILCLAFLKSGEKNMEKILIYQVKEKEAVKQLLAPMKIRLEEIKTTDLRQSIGDLAEGKKNVLTRVMMDCFSGAMESAICSIRSA